MRDLFEPATRQWLYNIASAVVPLLVTLGVLTGEVAGNVMAIVGAVLAFGANRLAANNVPLSDGGDAEHF